MEQLKSNTKVAGVDVGKRWLDAAVLGCEEVLRVANTPKGVEALAVWLAARQVRRVGLEATGGYERLARDRFEALGLEVVIHQPIEVKLFAKLRRLKAKNDVLDARLIAAATAQVETVRAAGDPRLRDLADRLTAYEQITDQAAELKTFLGTVRQADLVRLVNTQIRSLERAKDKLCADILARISKEPDLLARFKLLRSLPGIGPVVAASLLIRMPELGRLQRGKAASLIGVAPFDRDSGQFRGARFIKGGRARPRRMLYLAALNAKRFDPSLRVFAQRLIGNGKPAKLVVIAVMRKLVEAANLVLARNQPWVRHAAT